MLMPAWIVVCERPDYGKCFLLQVASFNTTDKSATFIARVLPLRTRALHDESDPEEQLQAGLSHLTGLNFLNGSL